MPSPDQYMFIRAEASWKHEATFCSQRETRSKKQCLIHTKGRLSGSSGIACLGYMLQFMGLLFIRVKRSPFLGGLLAPSAEDSLRVDFCAACGASIWPSPRLASKGYERLANHTAFPPTHIHTKLTGHIAAELSVRDRQRSNFRRAGGPLLLWTGMLPVAFCWPPL